MSQYTIKIASLQDCLTVHNHTPEMLGDATLAMYQERIGDNPYLALVAAYLDQPVAFKLGYAKSTDTFYSWLGGVLPNHRGHGLAKKLLHKQELWAVDNGFKCIEVKSMLRFEAMLTMLRTQGYTQTTADDGITEQSKIHFIKHFSRLPK
ncbi:GNAT family N-acetyltransferase [Pseudoalteromonas pernae]|uniref:GNAT family N-acetyltransferase n=1 Tax=Pseudoalteromonas pernae TaxID=3118054 RepID=UPI00324225B7